VSLRALLIEDGSRCRTTESTETRPSPDALLEHAEREGRGRLKIFLGRGTRRRQDLRNADVGPRQSADGVDVVIGVVETHGRKETMALVEGFEVIPRKIDYRGRVLEEMDIDAIIARGRLWFSSMNSPTPTRPGSRHPKRYLDVQENSEPGHRRLHDAQHPACREPERRRRPDHPHPGTRDGARLHHRPRRRRRDHRYHPGRSDQAAA
jgi:hypothetical protein